MLRPLLHHPVTTILFLAQIMLPLTSALAAPPEPDGDQTVHQLLATDPELQGLARELSATYQKVDSILAEGDRYVLREAQKNWPARRDRCGREKDVRACLVRAFETRITELRMQGGLGPFPGPAKYRCAGENGVIMSAVFYRGGLRPMIILAPPGGGPALVPVAPATTGQGFTGAGIVFLPGASGATALWDGNRYDCHPLAP